TGPERSATTTQGRKVIQTRSFRGSKSRNKVSVGEPAEGSLQSCKTPQTIVNLPKEPLLRRAAPGLSRVAPRPPAGARRRIIQHPVAPYGLSESLYLNKSKLSTTDLLVLASMKNAAKCDK